MWFATVADGVISGGAGGAGGGAGGVGGVGGDGLRSNGGDAKRLLLRLFGGWHEPVASLLRATAEGGIVGEDAVAMTRSGLRAARPPPPRRPPSV